MLSMAHVGMDVHKRSITVVIYPARGDTPLDRTRLPAEEYAVTGYLARWQQQYDLRCYYEAGPGGYVVYRWLQRRRIACLVAAPSKMLRASGDFVKTDRRDARMLAEQGRNGQLTAVRVPTPEEEAVRGLVRCRETRQRDVLAARQRVLKFLALRGRDYTAGKHWTQAHRGWLGRQQFSGPDAWSYQEYCTDLSYREQRLAEADRQVSAVAQEEAVAPLVRALCCFRGIDTLTAMLVVSETLDFRRFATARQYMSYLGLTCCEASTGETHRRGQITKAGSTRCRRALVEAAWHYRHGPAVGGRLAQRQAGQPAQVIAHAWKAQKRLHKVFHKLAVKDPRKAAVAVARELAGFLWAVARMIAADAE